MLHTAPCFYGTDIPRFIFTLVNIYGCFREMIALQDVSNTQKWKQVGL